MATAGRWCQHHVGREQVILGSAQLAIRVNEVVQLRFELTNDPIGIPAATKGPLPELGLDHAIPIPRVSGIRKRHLSVEGCLAPAVRTVAEHSHAVAEHRSGQCLDQLLERPG